MTKGERCSCTGRHFCSGVDGEVLETIAAEAGIDIEEARAQAFDGKWGGSGQTPDWFNPAQTAYRSLLKDGTIVPLNGKEGHLRLGQPSGSDVGQVRDQD